MGASRRTKDSIAKTCFPEDGKQYVYDEHTLERVPLYEAALVLRVSQRGRWVAHPGRKWHEVKHSAGTLIISESVGRR